MTHSRLSPCDGSSVKKTGPGRPDRYVIRSCATTRVLLQTILQPVQISEALLPALMAGLDVDMPGLAQKPKLCTPMASHFNSALGADGRVVVGADNLRRKRQQIGRNRREVAQCRWAIRTFDIGRRNQQRALHLAKGFQRRELRPVRDRHATQAMSDKDHWRALRGNGALQLAHPVFTARFEPVGLFYACAVGQAVLPMGLPMIIRRPLPAWHDQIPDRLVMHGFASCMYAFMRRV
ncbi:Ribonuclease G or E [Pseudomonas syringae pv. actinidiae]|uniref:Ribonuclease G or E n=1 Tax=Pseudomonas syringae pv. actinidiae TaxID=103796 RepID=A0A2V0QKF7_PSESF|nr:Ribonuclease G or E [Pseudomonas syringae pv. actinidiae]